MSAAEGLAGKRVLVEGLARSGLAAAEALVARDAVVLGHDRDESLDAGRLDAIGVEVHLGREEETLLQGIDLVVKSPGVPGEAPLVAGARERRVPVWSEIELGSRLLESPILGVTGTNGKTTTSELLGAIFRAAGRPVEVAGNVGRPLTSVVDAASDTWIVCELSSFQLEDVETLRPRIAVLLNLEPDHLDRHGTFERYADTKLRIFENQGGEDVAVVPRGFGAIPGSGERREFHFDDPLPAEPRIPGPHNRENAVAATVAARAAGIEDDAIAKALTTFAGVAHRIELVRELRGVRYVNDSKATNAAAARRALASFPESAPARDPRGPREGGALRRARRRLQARRPRLSRRPGSGGDRARADPRGRLVRALRRRRARRSQPPPSVAQPGDVVLLSPACASFDQFENFEARGDTFRRLVEELA